MLRRFSVRCVLSCISACTVLVSSVISAENYEKALQMGLYFFECQESGELSPGNRCPWRGPAHVLDGSDVGRNLSGGWYDAGDHWKANSTMAKAALMLAWSCIEWPAAYTGSDQMDELLNNLRYINDYFLTCIVDPAPTDTNAYDGYEVYVDVGGKPGPAPGVHSVWASPEVIEGYTVREALKATNTYPAADVEPAMAAAMCASAIVFDQYGGSSDADYAARLLTAARKLCIHTDRHIDTFFSNTVSDGNCLAVDPDGDARNVGYRSTDPYGSCISGFTWLHRAEQALGSPGYDDRFAQSAVAYEQKMNDAGGNHYAWWSSSSPKYACLALLMSGADIPAAAKTRMENAVDRTVDVWVETNPSDPNGVVVSPGGLHYRKNRANAFTISVMLNQSALAAFHAKYRTTKADTYISYIKSQIDYVLGNNPLEKSYMIGYDNDGSRDYLTVVHHRGAYGAWRSFEHFVSSKPFYRPAEVRHTMYGGVLLGNDAPDDSFTEEVMHHQHTEIALYANGHAASMLACLIADGHGEGSPMDDARFPPRATRSDNTDMYTTDREFFVIARLVSDDGGTSEIEAELHNRTRWPARRSGDMSFRYYFSLDGGASAADVSCRSVSSNGTPRISDPIVPADCDPYVSVSFPDDSIGPFVAGDCTQWCNYHKVRFTIGTGSAATWDRSNDWGNEGLSAEKALLTHLPVFQNDGLVGGQDPCGTTSVHPEVFASARPRQSRVRVRSAGVTITGLAPYETVRFISLNGRTIARGRADGNGVCRIRRSTRLPSGVVLIEHSGAKQSVPTPMLR